MRTRESTVFKVCCVVIIFWATLVEAFANYMCGCRHLEGKFAKRKVNALTMELADKTEALVQL